jgi:hypothetical protein
LQDWLVCGFSPAGSISQQEPDRNNVVRCVDETETLAGRLLLTIEKRKVFLTANFKPFGKGAAYSPAIEDEKSRREDRKPALKENKGD